MNRLKRLRSYALISILIVYLTFLILSLFRIEDSFSISSEVRSYLPIAFTLTFLFFIILQILFIIHSYRESKIIPFFPALLLLFFIVLLVLTGQRNTGIIYSTFLCLGISVSMVSNPFYFTIFQVLSVSSIVLFRRPVAFAETILLISISGFFIGASWIVRLLIGSYERMELESDKARWTATEFVRLNKRLQSTSVIQEAKGIQEERLSISRNLHDSLGHDLTSILILFRHVKELLPSENQETHNLMESIENLIHQALEHVRHQVIQLRDQDDSELSWPLKWRRLGMIFSDCTGSKITMKIDDLPGELSKDAGNAFFHIIQEGLTNAIRHGRATHVEVVVQMSESGEKVLLHISDNGRGSSMKSLNLGNGLRGMKERISVFGGYLLYDSMPDKGFDVGIECPREKVIL